LIDNPDLPISDYNFLAMRDRLKTKGFTVSATTITKRAKELGCYQPHRKHKVHDREVITTGIGALIQHDASTHRWSNLQPSGCMTKMRDRQFIQSTISLMLILSYLVGCSAPAATPFSTPTCTALHQTVTCKS
jgi:hypothetical protein